MVAGYFGGSIGLPVSMRLLTGCTDDSADLDVKASGQEQQQPSDVTSRAPIIPPIWESSTALQQEYPSDEEVKAYGLKILVKVIEG